MSTLLQEEQIIDSKTIAKTGARAIAEQLKVAGLIDGPNTLLAGNPGSGEELLYIEMSKVVQMALAEPAVGSMVDGAGRVLSKPAVAIAHGFVGFSGLQGAIFNAVQRQSPMLIIASVADTQAHTGETHMYADLEGTAKAIGCKYVKNATDSKTLLRDLRDAIIQSMIPPFGPVVFIVGANITSAANNEDVIKPILPNIDIAPPKEIVQELAGQILSASNPGILVGDGIARCNAYAEILEVAELLGAQVWSSMESEVNFPRHHEQFMGNLGHMDDAVGREKLKDLDFVLAVGTPLYQTVFNSKEPLVKSGVKVASINYGLHATLKGHTDVTLPINGNPKRVLSMLKDAINEFMQPLRASTIKSKRDELLKQRQVVQEKKIQQAITSNGLSMPKFAYTLEQHLNKLKERPIVFNEALVGAVGLTDYLTNVNMPGMYYDTSGGSLGEWAGAVGSAMLGKPTLAFIGDGGFHYVPQVLWNAAQRNLPIGFIVANNKKYGLLYDNMESALKKMNMSIEDIPHPHYYDLPDVDYVKIAEGYGIKGIKLDNEWKMEEAISQLLDFNYPFIIDLVLY